MDSSRRENGKVISYFKLRESQLPALAIYDTVDDKWDTLPIPEVTVEKVQGFCEGFLKGTMLVCGALVKHMHCSSVCMSFFTGIGWFGPSWVSGRADGMVRAGDSEHIVNGVSPFPIKGPTGNNLTPR